MKLDWRNIEGYFLRNDYDVLKKVSEFHSDEFTVLEIGTHYGQSAVAWASLGAKVHCVDCWDCPWDKENRYSKFLENIEGYDITHQKIPYREIMTTDMFDGSNYDVVFYDACHSYTNTYNMIKYWKNKVDTLVLDDVIMLDVERAISDNNINMTTMSFPMTKIGYVRN